MKKIVLTGGGTAGHVTPNIALIPYLKKAGYDVYYIGSKGGMEEELIKKCDVPYYGISSGKLRRYFDTKNFSDMFRVSKGVLEAKALIKRIKPDVVFSKGGFVAVPVVVGAAMCKVPVVAHESDMTPGLANRLTMPFAKAVCTTFSETVAHIKDNKGIHTGTPIRDSLFEGSRQRGIEFCGFEEDKPVILIMGGSQGAVRINNIIRALADELLKQFNIIHLCGKGNLSQNFENKRGYRQYEYISEELPDILAASDIIISRAGSNAICEFLALNKPMLLIPLGTNAGRGDQILNAESFKKRGFAEVCSEADMTKEGLYKQIIGLYENREKYIEAMKNDETANGIEEVLDIIKAATK